MSAVGDALVRTAPHAARGELGLSDAPKFAVASPEPRFARFV